MTEGIHDLISRDVLLYLFCKLPLKDLYSVQLTCKTWYEVTKKNRIKLIETCPSKRGQQILVLKGSKKELGNYAEILKKFCKLAHISQFLTNQKNISPQTLQYGIRFISRSLSLRLYVTQKEDIFTFQIYHSSLLELYKFQEIIHLGTNLHKNSNIHDKENIHPLSFLYRPKSKFSSPVLISCGICGKKVKSHKALKRHWRVEKHGIISCLECGEFFANVRQRRQHCKAKGHKEILTMRKKKVKWY